LIPRGEPLFVILRSSKEVEVVRSSKEVVVDRSPKGVAVFDPRRTSTTAHPSVSCGAFFEGRHRLPRFLTEMVMEVTFVLYVF
jgi:ABC-type enterochelin transport system substrate-binding protein